MSKTLDWFLDREGSYILRGSTEVFIPNEEIAKKLFEMQSKDYVFSEKVRVFKAPQPPCASSES